MIEILIAVLVLSIGLLGLAALQTTALRHTQSANQRLDATTLAYDILERMRANRTQALDGNYDVALAATPQGSGTALADVQAWKADLVRRLPEGDGSIEVDERIATVSIEWKEDWDAANADPDKRARVLMRSQL